MIPKDQYSKLNDILIDFISALDEAVATYKVLEKIKEDDTKPNQLLYCHIVNNFDSFVTSFLEDIVLSKEDRVKEYLGDKKLNEKMSFNDLIEINEFGMHKWMKKQALPLLENDIKRKRHSQKLEMLLKQININPEKIFVYLMGGSGKEYTTGCLKRTATPKSRLTTNHKTTSEKLLGYADILYEKRNSVTHNRSKYLKKTITRLNQDWGLEIERDFVMIRRSTIKSLIRFYTSVTQEVITQEEIKTHIQYQEHSTNLGNIKKLQSIKALKNENDERFVDGGVNERKEIINNFPHEKISIKEYKELSPKIKDSTAYRDFKFFIEEGLMKKTEKRGIYKITKKEKI